MSWFKEQLLGRKEYKEAAPTIGGTQQALLDQIAGWLQERVGTGATPYTAPTVAGIPSLYKQAYGQYASGFGDVMPGTGQAIGEQIAGRPAYAFSPSATTRQWQETYASPVMQTWRETVAPLLTESYNVPGAFHSWEKGRGMERAAGQFYGGQVAPTLFAALQAGEQRGAASLEAAEERRLPAAEYGRGLPYRQFGEAAGVAGSLRAMEQERLAAAYQEFLRTAPESDPFVKMGMGLATTPTMDWIAWPEHIGGYETFGQAFAGSLGEGFGSTLSGGGGM